MDRKGIELVIQDYFDASFEGNGQKMGTVFYDTAHIYGRGEEDALADMSKDEFVERVSSSEASADYPRQDEIVSIEFTGENSAVAIVKLRVGETLYTDILTFVRLQDKWSVIAKLYAAVAL